MNYLTFSMPDFPTNQKLAMTAIDLMNKILGYPNDQGTKTCSDVILHPDGIQVAVNLMSPCDDIAQKQNNFGGNFIKDKLPDDWYKDLENKEFIESKFDETKVDSDKDPESEDDGK